MPTTCRSNAALLAGLGILLIPAAGMAQSGSGTPFSLTAGHPSSSPWAFQASGLVSHFREARCDNCEYRTSVPGIGLQRDIGLAAGSPFVYSLSGGLQTDSFGRSGGYAAAVASLAWRGDSWLLRPGLGAFAFYRYMDDEQKRDLVPAILPVLGVENARTGIGATLLVAPNFTYAGTERSGFVFLQFTFRLGTRG